jgi:very-short-patch-repair endonuclease
VLPDDTVCAGRTAAWLHGLDLDAANPVEVIVPVGSWARSRAGLRVRRCSVEPHEIVQVRDRRATSIDRTLRDVSRHAPDVEVLVAIDAALRRGLTNASRLTGNRRLRRLAALAAPAESPMETRLRWLLIQAGLPRPEVQVDLGAGRADLFYQAAGLVIEYDGANHRDRLVEDNLRQNVLVDAGYRLLRYTASDVYQRPDFIVTQIRRALRV